MDKGSIHIGVGGWTFEPWRGVFYPSDCKQKDELKYASRHLTCIEINGTYYSLQRRDSWRKWGEETPDGFVERDRAHGTLPDPSWRLVPDEGFEPPTFGLQNRCSTAELSRQRRYVCQDTHAGNPISPFVPRSQRRTAPVG